MLVCDGSRDGNSPGAEGTDAGAALIISTGHAVSNAGVLEAVSGGTLAIDDAVRNANIIETLAGGTALISGSINNSGGTLFASGAGSLIEIAGGVVVSGGLVEIGDGVVDVRSCGTANVLFMSHGSGGLIIADTAGSTAAFTGKVSGFGAPNHSNGAQFIELGAVGFSAGEITSSYVSSGPHSGTLHVSSSSVEVAAINFVGNYSAGNFHISAASDGNVEITDPAVPNGGSVAPGPTAAFPRQGIDLPNIAFGAHTTLAYSENAAGAGGTLTVTDGRHAAAIALFGSYMAGNFVTTADGHGGTLVTAAEQPQPPLLTQPRHG